jgi:hypothetical protein
MHELVGLKYNLATLYRLARDPTNAARTVHEDLELRLKRVGACSLSASRSTVTVQAEAAAPLTFSAARVGQSAGSHGVLVGNLPRLVLNTLRLIAPGSALRATSVAKVCCALAAACGLSLSSAAYAIQRRVMH